MSSSNGHVYHWTRQLAALRAQVVKRARVAAPNDLVEDALAICDSLLQDLAGAEVENERLRADANASNDAWDHFFTVMPVACLMTDTAGTVLTANRAAGALLNVGAKHLKDRQLVVFSEDRQTFATLLQRLGHFDEQEIRTTFTVRPKERRRMAVDVTLVRATAELPNCWLWFMTQAGQPEKAAHTDMAAAARALRGGTSGRPIDRHAEVQSRDGCQPPSDQSAP